MVKLGLSDVNWLCEHLEWALKHNLSDGFSPFTGAKATTPALELWLTESARLLRDVATKDISQ